MFHKVLPCIFAILFLCFFSNVKAQPSSYDWRDVGGVNYISAVRNQNIPPQDFGTCLAHSVIAALEAKAVINGVILVGQADFSEQIFASCCYIDGEYCGGHDWGRKPQMLQYIRDTGVPLESCVPYLGWGFYDGKGCVAPYVCSSYLTNVYKVSSYTEITPATVANLKSAIYTYGPVMTEFKVYTDFDTFFAGNPTGVYSYVNGINPAWHAVIIVGYNDTGSYFICKNSRGIVIEDSGFFKIAYSEVGGTTAFGSSSYYLGTVIAYAPSSIQGLTITGGTLK